MPGAGRVGGGGYPTFRDFAVGYRSEDGENSRQFAKMAFRPGRGTAGESDYKEALMADLDIVELVKERNRIEDVIEADGYPLPQRGRYRKCSTKGTGGLVIDIEAQAYFWNTRAENGDVIAWVQKQHRMDFKGAVEWLCERAGLPRPNWGSADPAARLAARMREEALDVAQRVFIRWLAKSPEAQAYVARRGWSLWQGTDEEGEKHPGTAVKAMLGYSGEGTDHELAEMRKELQEAGVDLESPAAVAILGYRGDVVAWANKHQVPHLTDEWVVKNKVPGILGHKRLVYPHVRNGRIIYLSGRSIDVKYHYNLPESLVGKRQPMFNHMYAPGCEQCIVVEGQADAISLGQLGFPAVALAGVSPDENLVELLKKHKSLYVGLDADKAGHANEWRVAEALGPMVRLVSWRSHYTGADGVNSVKDANDLLLAMIGAGENEEAQRAFITGLIAQAPTYVEAICAWAGAMEGAARDEALPKALAVVARLDGFRFDQYRKELAKALRVTIRELENMLKTLAKKAADERSMGEPVYTWGGVVDGWLIEYLYDQENDAASLAWRDPEGRIGSGEFVNINGRSYRPSPPNDPMRSGAIIFPSSLGESRSIAELVAYIELYLKSIYLMPSDKTARLIAYWILTTYLYDTFETVIYLRAMGGAGSGKSELIKRIGMACYRTMTANGAGSTSSLFRSVERYKGTVLLDEADLAQSDTEQDMIKFYNLGAMRGNPIWRTVEVTGPNGEKDWEAVSFQTFCPKLIAMRKDFRDDAVGSRSLTLRLVPREMTELKAAGIPLTINNSIRARAQALRNLLVRWRLATWQPEIEVDMDLYEMSISPRLNQVAGPLLAIARDDPEQQEDIRRTLREYYAESIITQSMTLSARVIEAMWKIWNYPDLHKGMVKIEEDGGASLIKIGDITRITNEIINEMNDEEEEDSGDGKFKSREVKSQRVGRIIRTELSLQVTNRRRDGFWVYWNEPRLQGLSTKYGINPEDFGPQNGKAAAAVQKEIQPVEAQ